jgi:HK97 gp10 family phage protein
LIALIPLLPLVLHLLVWDDTRRALRDVQQSDELRANLKANGDRVAARARVLAPKDTGAGAASIHCEVIDVNGFPEARVSWTPEHFYMGFAELGTQHQRATPFLRRAADSFR